MVLSKTFLAVPALESCLEALESGHKKLSRIIPSQDRFGNGRSVSFCVAPFFCDKY